MTAHHDPSTVAEPIRSSDDERDTGSDLPPGFRSLYAGCERPPHRDRPWVLANMVTGIDGSATLNGRAGDLSDPTDQELFAFLRTQADAVLVGAETVRVEQYGALTARSGRSPRMVIVTASGRLDFGAPLFTESDQRPLVVTISAKQGSVAAAAGSRAEVVAAGDDAVDIASLLRALRHNGIERLLTEGGPTLLSEIIRTASLDELCITIAPVVGGGRRRVFENTPPGRSMTLAHSVAHGDRIFCRYLCR